MASSFTAWWREKGARPLAPRLSRTSRAWRKQIPSWRSVSRLSRRLGIRPEREAERLDAYRTAVLADDIVGLIHAFEAERATSSGTTGVAASLTLATSTRRCRPAGVLNCPIRGHAAGCVRTGLRSERAGSIFAFSFVATGMGFHTQRREGAQGRAPALRQRPTLQRNRPR